MYYGNNNPFEYNSYRNAMCNDAKKTFSRLHFSIFAYIISAYVIGIVVELILFLIWKEEILDITSNVYYRWIMGVLPMYAVGLPILFLIVRNMPKRTLKKSKLDIGEFIILFAIAQALMYIGNLIGNTLNGFIGAIIGDEISNTTAELVDASPLWLTTVIGVIIGPIVEEFIFRKLMIERLSRFGSLVAIAVSSVSFGLFHGNFYQFFYSALLGLVLGYITVRTGNWLYSVAMHALINFFGSVAIMPVIDSLENFQVSLENLASGKTIDMNSFIISLMAILSYSVINCAIVITGFALLYNAIKKKRFRIRPDAEVNIPREDVVSVIFSNAGTIAYLIASLVLFAISIFLG